MKRLSLIGLIAVLSVITMLLFCAELPVNQSADPDNAEVVFFIENGQLGAGVLPVELGSTLKIGLRMVYPKHLETVRITSSCKVFEKVIVPDTSKSFDTIYFTPEFGSEGPCTLFVDAPCKRTTLKDKMDSLAILVMSGQPGINFITVPQARTIQTGNADTLLFVTKTSGGAGDVKYTISTTPALDAQQLDALYSPAKDTVRIICKPALVDTYAVTIIATATQGGKEFKDTASAEIRVTAQIGPSKVDAPPTLVAGTADTLVFAVDNSTRTDKLTMKLVTDKPLDTAVFTVLSTGTDSLLIRVAPTATAAAGTVKIGICTSNGTQSDTSWYPVTLIDKDAALWNKTEVAVTATEGKPVQQDLRPYLIAPLTGPVTFVTDKGTVVDTVWQWTPTYGCAASASATITATKGATSLGLKLAITVTPSDITKPTLQLADPSLDGKKISSSQLTVACIAKDSEAGAGSVTITNGSTTVDAVVQNENEGKYSGVITGLKNGVPTQITITAIDKSMQKNKETLTFTVTYDSTILDAEPPVIAYVSGSKSGERVKSASGTIVFGITDNSGVDSSWWTLNGTYAGGMEKQADGKFALTYSLTTYGNNTLTIHAQDKTVSKNKGSTEVKLVYNVAPAAVVAAAPANSAADEATEPTFSWTGGTDADGDTVFYVVSYGTAENSLTTRTAETKVAGVTIAAANKLAVNTTYYWKVTAYTKTPYADTVESVVSLFKTSGSAPSITTQPATTVSVNEGGTLTLTVVASGTPAPTSYQWYKDDAALTGKTAAELSKANVTASDAGSYHVVVSNGIGTGVTSTKAVVTVKLKATITEDPVAAMANEGGSATFTVKATGEAPITYEWLKDGQVITGASSATYTISAAATTDDGKKFSCIVSNAVGKDTSVAALLTVTATPVFKVTFEGTTIAAMTVKSGGTVEKPADPLKDGYAFGGWYTSSTYATAFNFTTPITGATTIYAKWNAVMFAVSFDVVGGSAVASQQVQSGGKATKPADPTKEGFEFGGWYTSSTYGTAFNFTTATINGPTTIYAKWTQTTYTVTFDGQGATTAPSPTTKTGSLSGVGTLPTDPKKTSYVFDGWYTGTAGTGSVFSASTPVSVPITVYAKWVIKDTDGNTYTQIKIGNQVWMVENLKTTKYNNGNDIPLVKDSESWAVLSSIAYCWPGGDQGNVSTYGLLYNWYTVQSGKLAPDGWHIASAQEWKTLVTYLGDSTVAGGKLKESGTNYWSSPNEGGSNESGFTAIPGGCRQFDGTFELNGFYAYWWASTDYAGYEGKYAYDLYIDYSTPGSRLSMQNKNYGLSVRCLRNQE